MTLQVAVVGAGAFGGWTALHLRRAGHRVTLVDAWGAGHSRASSGGETRVIRGMYGGERLYVELTIRSFALWWEHEQRCGRRLYHRLGALWMYAGDDRYARATLPLLRAAGLEAAELSTTDAARRWPQIDFTGVRTVFHESEAGYLLARQGCETVREMLVAEGGEYLVAHARPEPIQGGGLRGIALSSGATLRADRFVFACGPWLGTVFPDVIGRRVTPTRQEVFFFGLPPGDRAYDEGECPVWVDHGERFIYGIPGNERRGFKVADDSRGPPIDPTTEERLPSAEGLARARDVLRRRFPGLTTAPLVEARVCQYEQSPDGDFILDRHPLADNVWLAGGGSGHGYKMGPAVGEHVARLVLGTAKPDAKFSLGRLT
ncbi:MAG TPA: FAD-dependent oxidoreductase [Gemmatimonadales bacterium]|nr:FAD-dependent oxidoreductase [Gemmatimonadales bacterium]